MVTQNSSSGGQNLSESVASVKHQCDSNHLQRRGVTTKQMFKVSYNYSKTSRRTFFRACVFSIFLPHIWNGFIFFCGFYSVFLVPCIVLVSEMLSFTMVTKFNYVLI